MATVVETSLGLATQYEARALAAERRVKELESRPAETAKAATAPDEEITKAIEALVTHKLLTPNQAEKAASDMRDPTQVLRTLTKVAGLQGLVPEMGSVIHRRTTPENQGTTHDEWSRVKALGKVG